MLQRLHENHRKQSSIFSLLLSLLEKISPIKVEYSSLLKKFDEKVLGWAKLSRTVLFLPAFWLPAFRECSSSRTIANTLLAYSVFLGSTYLSILTFCHHTHPWPQTFKLGCQNKTTLLSSSVSFGIYSSIQGMDGKELEDSNWEKVLVTPTLWYSSCRLLLLYWSSKDTGHMCVTQKKNKVNNILQWGETA